VAAMREMVSGLRQGGLRHLDRESGNPGSGLGGGLHDVVRKFVRRLDKPCHLLFLQSDLPLLHAELNRVQRDIGQKIQAYGQAQIQGTAVRKLGDRSPSPGKGGC
jgi:hypothetical protein